MTTINAVINGKPFGGAAKRIDIIHESGGVGSWELKLDNSTDASEILAVNHEASDLGINGAVLMKGKVDDVLPDDSDPKTVISKYVKVVGRNFGRPLVDRFLVKKYANFRIDDLFEDALAAVGCDIVYVSPSSGDFVDVDFNKTFLQSGFVEAANRIGYDFTVDNSKNLLVWKLVDNTPHSGVLLKSVAGDVDNNILLVNPETRAGVDIRNFVRVDGGRLRDHWTEGNAVDWSGENCTFTDDDELFVSGSRSIKVQIISAAAPAKAYLAFPLYNHDVLDLSSVISSCRVWVNVSSPARIFLYAKDDAGNEIIYGVDVDCTSAVWQETKFDMGLGTGVFPSSIKPNEWHYLTGSSFSWNHARFGLYLPAYFGLDVNLDGLEIDGVDVWAIAEDAASQGSFDRRDIPLTRTDVKSQLELQAVAETEKNNRKNPIFKLNLICTLQTELLYSGYTVDVLVPSDNIGSGSTPVRYRTLLIHHAGEPGVDLCRGHDDITILELILHDDGAVADPTRFKLTSSPQAAINARYDSRLRNLEKSNSGSGSLLGRSGGVLPLSFGDIIANSFLAITPNSIGAGFKLGLANGTTYLALAYDNVYAYINAYGRTLQLATDAGFGVDVQRDLRVLGNYRSADNTVGATANVAVAKVGGGTRTLQFKNGLYVGYSDS